MRSGLSLPSAALCSNAALMMSRARLLRVATVVGYLTAVHHDSTAISVNIQRRLPSTAGAIAAAGYASGACSTSSIVDPLFFRSSIANKIMFWAVAMMGEAGPPQGCHT
jgi:hypothetical protein